MQTGHSPVVGIVTRTKNRTVLLRRALSSVLSQTYPHWKLVVVNDGGEPTAVDQLIAAHPDRRIQVLHHPKSLGMEAASNAGIKRLDTDLLVIHDDDDSWAPDFLAVCVAELERVRRTIPSVHGIATHSNRVLERTTGNTVEIEYMEPFNVWVKPGLLSFDRVLYENFIPPISFLFRKDSADAIQGFREDLPVLGDWDFLVRFMSRHDVYLVPESLAFYHHRTNGTGAMGNTVIDGAHQHHLYRDVLLNEWLRQDLTPSRTGLGTYANMRGRFEHVERQNARLEEKLDNALRRIEDLQRGLYNQVLPVAHEPITRLKDIQVTLYEQLMPKLNQTLAQVDRLMGLLQGVRERLPGRLVNRVLRRRNPDQLP